MGLHFRSGWSRAGRCSVSDVQSFRPLGKLKSGGREDLPYRLSSAGVDRFFKEILGRTYQTEVATGYQKRFGKNRDRLFTFLDHDGVPWNNNNAEHAIKAFARLRNIFGGTSTVKGMREYLILLSISETCKNKDVRFLDFLLSGESDVGTFSRRADRSA